MIKLKSLAAKVKRLWFLLTNRGLRWTYNYLHLCFFYNTTNSFLNKYLYRFTPYPSYIEIEVTTRCNLRCILCEHTYWNEPSTDMSFENFRKIVNQFPRLKWIGLTGIGESFLHKDFLKMLSYVKSKSAYVELYDTFYFIEGKVAEKLVELKVDRIFVSLDAATKKTYEKIRVGSDFERVINNVKNLIILKERKKTHWPEIYFHFVVQKNNYLEMPLFIELVHSLTQGTNSAVQFSRMLHWFEEVKKEFIEVSQEIIQETENKGKELGVKVWWNLDVPQDKPPISRCTAWTMPFIFATGHVIPCCAGNEANRRDFQKEHSLGNVFKTDFRDIWTGEKYKKFRSMLRKGEIPIQCKDCPLFNVEEPR